MSNKPSPTDHELFKQAMQDVTPLKPTDKVVQVTPKPKAKRVQQPEFPEPEHLDREELPPVTSEEALFYAATGLQRQTIRRLKRGQIPVEANLDLHKHTVEQAESALSQFLRQSQQHQLYCVRIVHGKSLSYTNAYPKIKNYVNQWLRSHPATLAFCSTLPKHGGTGALYVLLRRSVFSNIKMSLKD